MSKKRKTRKQKEHAHIRIEERPQQATNSHIHIQTPIYSVNNNPVKADSIEKEERVAKSVSVEQKDIDYLKHDISSITAASGIIVSFDILLFVLLVSGILHLHILGY